MTQDTALDCVLRYHERTKHQPHRSARSLGYLDWATQPDPFRRFEGAPLLPLWHPSLANQPTYDALFGEGPVAPQPVDLQGLSRLFFHSLALSAWKQAAGTSPWSLRVNPSSGALHPTEGYLLVGPAGALGSAPAVYHYSPLRHALEQRITLTPHEWQAIAGQLPADSALVALTSIYWREAWKYGERAFRYCHHDVGHAIAAVTFAAATLGWQTRLVQTVSDIQLSAWLGTERQHGPEAEHPDCLLAVFPRQSLRRSSDGPPSVPASGWERLSADTFAGTPNCLSSSHHPWPMIEEVSDATRYPGQVTLGPHAFWEHGQQASSGPDRGRSAEQMIRQRRSAIDMDGCTSLDRAAFYRLLQRATPRGFPFDVLPWSPHVSLAVFVHRVDDLAPGLYVLARGHRHRESLREALRRDFAWTKPAGCPDELDLWLLREADCREAAKFVSCQQDIAADGVCSLGMLAEFEAPLRDDGPWIYPRLFWETGLIGQLLYLEAEAAGLRGCGIGCFFDDVMHELLGLCDARWQSLYHFTIGGPQDDPRLKTIASYAHLQGTV